MLKLWLIGKFLLLKNGGKFFDIYRNKFNEIYLFLMQLI